MDRILKKPIVVISLAVLCTALWGSAFPAVKTGYELFAIQNGTEVDKMIFAGMRFFIAGLVVLLVVLSIPGKRLTLKRQDYGKVAILGVVQTFIQYFFFYISLSNLAGSKGSILNATGTFFVVILSHFIFQDEKLNIRKSLGCILGFVGIVVVNLTEGIDLSFHMQAEGFMLLAALSFALGSIYSKLILKGMDALVLTGYQLAFGGLLLLLTGFIGGGSIGTITLQGSLLFAYLVLISSVGFGVWTLLIKYNPVTKISIYNCLTPVFGTILSGIFLSEGIMKLNNLLALIGVVMGIYLVNSKGGSHVNYNNNK